VGAGGCSTVVEGEYEGKPVAVKIATASPYIELLRDEGEHLVLPAAPLPAAATRAG
jgi:hypothetical protein